MNSFSIKRNLLVSLAVFLISVASAWAQTGTSSVVGTITDPQGKPVAGAKVTLTNVATNAARSTQSSGTGAYLFDLISPADYRLEIEAKGFNKEVIDNVRALIGRPTETNVQLSVGAMSQTVEVKASLQDAVINTLDGVDINNAQTGNAEVPRTTNNLVIGQIDTDRHNITTGPVLRLNTEAIEEFRVTTANGNANQGSTSGAQVNLVTKSGSNALHGSAFEFYRGTAFEANDWFNNAAGVPRTNLVRNTFSGGLGGPIVKDKLFFFYNYEGRRDATASPESRVVPLASLGQGIINYTYCPDKACNAPVKSSLSAQQVQQVYSDTGINQTALKALADAAAKYPANDTTQGDGLNTGGFRFNAPTPIKLNSHVAKFDYTLNSKQNLFARLNVIYDHQVLPQWLPGTASPLVWSHPRGVAVGHNWTIGNNWVNNLRYGFTRQAFSQGGDSTGNDISFRFVFQPNGQTHTVSRITPVHNITDDLSWIHGNHTIQFGANFRKIKNARVSFANAFDNAVTNPSFYFGAGDHVNNAFQNYLTTNNLPGGQAGQSLNSSAEVQNAATAAIGRFSEYTANFTFNKDGSLFNPGIASSRNFATQAYDEYVQDSWKIRPHFTLTLGLRYSLERPVYETQGFEVQPTIPLGTYFKNPPAPPPK